MRLGGPGRRAINRMHELVCCFFNLSVMAVVRGLRVSLL